MEHTLATLAAQVRATLQEQDDPTGRQRVATLLREALADRAFVDSLFEANAPERRIVHEDPELGFCILAHRYTDAKKGPPHDHGPSWAIYGQADGETVMSDWEQVGEAAPGSFPRVKKLREYAMRPGDVHVYDEGAIHAPSRSGPTRLVRIEGTNLERVARGRYEAMAE
jgi:predicted metal-dependent enzyme (double-stranded beta helix superfamily)